jgi:hypothetical protein
MLNEALEMQELKEVPNVTSTETTVVDRLSG